jgi:hypothetical protein
MCKKDLVRVSLLLPNKAETRKMFNSMTLKLARDFGGLTYCGPSIPFQVDGIWPDENGNIVKDQHILLWVDVDISNGIDVDEYFSNFKAQYEKLLCEQVLWITFQPLVRVV